MISFVKGFVEEILENYVIINNNNIGYGINVSGATINKLTLNSEAKLFTHMIVREDELSLYGFTTREELKMFNQLLTVSGVGPKGALSLLNSLTPSQLALAIITEDIKSLSTGQGIGKKTAQRIALELKDKISNEQAVENSEIIANVSTDTSAKGEAMEGLLALGFSKSEASQAINAIYSANLTSSQLISKALKVLN